ncbi:WD40 repeat protein [Pedobacter nutrimenti]|jgi:outer membrane protein OmpA-like peptidoglycan-associated protein|uniref:WD40 repeat protein n=2 Tax=Pedobacter nutrimenti TaxID=1241337 RepID=A0A318UR48_9SPHI|nr:WD40 repeat protein [Pedobacter nutrimenti]
MNNENESSLNVILLKAMKQLRSGLFILMVLLASVKVQAQYVLKEADAQYEVYNYAKAIDLYEQAYKKKASLHAAERLAESYRLSDNYKQAESWYAIASAMPGSKAENLLYYAKALQGNSKYSEARAQYEKYAALNPAVTADQKKVWLLSCDSAQYWMKNPVTLSVQNEKKLNSTSADWGAVPYKNGLVFTSDRPSSGKGIQAKSRPFLKFDGSKLPSIGSYGWTGNEYLRLYEQSSAADSVHIFPLKTETFYHIAAASFTADGQQMYFTLTRIPKKIEKVKGQPSTLNIEIYSSTKNADGSWGLPVPFRYNKINEWSVGDPFITPDGNTLYFVSSMPGGKGGTDLYSCSKNPDGTWSDAVNLDALNSPGNERSPFVSSDGTFYFSSDGRIGMGGLDVYKSVKSAAGFGTPLNLGYPLNSPQDDFFFRPGADGTGFFASNRPEGMGSDDIYSFVKQAEVFFKLEGTVYDRKTRAPLANAVVTLKKQDGNSLRVETAAGGQFKFNLEKASSYILTAEKTAYRSDQAELSTQNLVNTTVLHQDLFLEEIKINEPIKIENIYYDFDKWAIRPDAATELDKLVALMKSNETLWVELGSHTDSRGKDQYNLTLSQKRADAAVAYIVARGIHRNRITAKGYGESRPVNACTNGVKCTEAEYQLNRRTEFKIVKQ